MTKRDTPCNLYRISILSPSTASRPEHLMSSSPTSSH